MMNDLIRLFLVLCITFAPIGQGMAIDIVDKNPVDMDMAVMNGMTETCLDCSHTMDNGNNSCMNDNCFQDGCISSFSAPVFSILSSSKPLTIDSVSIAFRDLYRHQFISQIPLPLYRPPIV